MKSSPHVLHLATHLNLGGIPRYLQILAPRLRAKGWRVSMGSSGGRLVPDLRAEGYDCPVFGIKTKMEANPKLLLALPSLVSWIRRERVDLIHAHSRVTQVLSVAASLLTGVPFVTTAHGHYHPRLSRRLLPAWGRRVIAVSPLVADMLENVHRVPRAKIRVVQNGIDSEDWRRRVGALDRTKCRKEFGFAAAAFVCGSISRLVEDKGHVFLVEAARQLAARGVPIGVLIVGNGRAREDLERRVREAGLEGRVVMAPALLDVAPALAAMDVFVHPATFREGFGLAILEAMSASLPVVTTDIWALNAILENGKNAILVPPSDAAALAAAIELLRNDPARRRTLSEGAFRFASECSADRMAAETEAVYREAMGEPASPAGRPAR